MKMNLVKPHIYVSREQIADTADQLLTNILNSAGTLKWPQLADQAADLLDLSILWEDFETIEDGVIAAKIYPANREIFINNAFPAIKNNPGLYQSTLAHEIGHWLLHINWHKLELMNQSNHTEVFLCRSLDEDQKVHINSKTPDDWREWQAQYFASCLLMPLNKIEEVRQGRNLTNWKHLNAIADELGVTLTNLRNRLQDLKYLEKSGNSKQLYFGTRLK